MTEPEASVKRRRGLETTLDMIRSLAVVMLLVIPLWYFGQGSPSDKKAIRPVDPAPALVAFARDTGAPVPATPPGWVPNVVRGEDGGIRVGYVVGEHYLEYAGGSGPTFVTDVTGKGRLTGPVDVDGVTWQRYVDAAGHESLLRTAGTVTVAVGGVRESVTGAEVRTLAAAVR